MVNITSALGVIGGTVGILTGLFSLIYLRRQTLIMAAQVDKEIEIKITRDLDAPESEIDNKLRAYLNRRLADIRRQIRDDFAQRIDDLSRSLDDSPMMGRRDTAEATLRLLSDQKDAVETVKESNSKMSTLEHQIQELQQTVEDIRSGVGNQTMVRAQIRGIAEQLLRMTGQE